MPVAEQAAAWVVALDGEQCPGQQRAFEQWLQASELHRSAYEQALQNWLMAAQLRQMPELLDELMPELPMQVSDGLSAGPVAQPHMPARTQTRKQMHMSTTAEQPSAWSSAWTRQVRRAGMLATLAVAVLVGGLLSWSGGDPYTAVLADYRSATGEIRDVQLSDGSTVRLDSASAIAVHYGQDQRRIELLKGRALFLAAPIGAAAAGGRPFVVATDDGRTQALGTQFIVERLGRQTVVTGVEHHIAVGTHGMPLADAVILAPGQSVRYDENGLGPVESIPLAQAQSWEKGMLLFDDAPLQEVLAQLERYQGGRIVLRAEAMAQRHVSASVPAQDIRAGLDAIAAELGLRVQHLPLLTVLY
ncbi:FecR family protein [Corticibacter populi]|nr:FecR domain-containing protein [Corticibacter populi]RZS29894.1 FecR family protein [Corticibacter populi]